MESHSLPLIKKFNVQVNEIQLERQTSPQTYCESVGRQSAILGFERGVFEIWVYPLKICSDLQFSVSIPEYNLVIKGTDIAKRIIVRPELTTINFSHDLFTIQWHLLAPLNEPGVVLLFDIDTYATLELWISFRPNLLPMWPAGLGGQYTLWFDELRAYYIGEGSKKYVGLIGSPLATRLTNTPGHQLPDGPMRFMIEVTRHVAVESFIPIIITGSVAGKDVVIKQYYHLLNSIPDCYQQNYDHYQRLHLDFLNIKTQVPELDLAFEWAKVSLDKGLVKNPQLGPGLVAGYGVSGKTHRPGFAWFFGGDTFLNSLAINSYGDFETTRQALILLRENQRHDGKIFHELTQSAAFINWFQDYPYGFYHAETSAFYIAAMYDYFIRSGDGFLISESWDSIKKAYQYCLSADEDQDGLMENSAAGLAAMEVGAMLEQNRVDVYLASIWLQALQCMIKLSEFLREKELAEKCQHQFDRAFISFKQTFVDEMKREVNFALLTTGEKHTDSTVWQSIPLFFNLIDANSAKSTMQCFASSEMSTDWGIRGVSRMSKYYDPVSYNNGSVWPFTTGYVATAQYKHHDAVNGWHNLMANARMTWLDALGWQPELLSGEYYRPVTTAVPHQLFSATGIILPLTMGLSGLESNASTRQIKFAPHLPPGCDELTINNYYCGKEYFNFHLLRSNDRLNLEIQPQGEQPYRFIFSPAFGLGTQLEKVKVNGQEVDYELQLNQYDVHCEIKCDLKNHLSLEIKFCQGIEFNVPLPAIRIGSPSQGLKLIDYELIGDVLTVILEGLGGCEYVIPLKTPFQIAEVVGGKMRYIDACIKELIVRFENQSRFEFVRQKVQLSILRR